jgi:hypothetical protein
MEEFYPKELSNAAKDSRFRPYLTGVSEHEDTLATILLYSNSPKEGSVDATNKPPIDYLTNLSSKVNAIYSETAVRSYETSGKNQLEVGSMMTGGEIATIPLDGNNDYFGVFNNFSLLAVQESYSHIVKVHTNFGADWNGFFFGDQPVQFQFSGFFLDTPEYPYYQEFMVAYDRYLSGRKCIENNMLTKFMFEGIMVEGYLISINVTNTYENRYAKNFNFTVLSSGRRWIRMNKLRDVGGSQIDQFNALSNAARFTSKSLGESLGFRDLNPYVPPKNSPLAIASGQ